MLPIRDSGSDFGRFSVMFLEGWISDVRAACMLIDKLHALRTWSVLDYGPFTNDQVLTCRGKDFVMCNICVMMTEYRP